MILFEQHRGWTYTIEYFTDEASLPDRWMLDVQWYVFDRDKCIQAGQADSISDAEKLAKAAINWRAT